jgi:hypothetical protein
MQQYRTVTNRHAERGSNEKCRGMSRELEVTWYQYIIAVNVGSPVMSSNKTSILARCSMKAAWLKWEKLWSERNAYPSTVLNQKSILKRNEPISNDLFCKQRYHNKVSRNERETKAFVAKRQNENGLLNRKAWWNPTHYELNWARMRYSARGGTEIIHIMSGPYAETSALFYCEFQRRNPCGRSACTVSEIMWAEMVHYGPWRRCLNGRIITAATMHDCISSWIGSSRCF